jgi:hypothetical protein
LGKNERLVEVPLRVTKELLETVPEHEVRQRIQHLVGLFKQDYEKLFPVEIGEHDFLFLAHLSFALESLKTCRGFDSHLAEFRNDVDSTYLVTVLAAYLLPRVRDLELEPEPAPSGKRADIRVELDNGLHEVFFECKNPRREVLGLLREEAEPMYEALRRHVTRPCDVTLAYWEPLSEDDLTRLGRFLEEKLPMVTGEGTILDREGIQVDVTRVREAWEDVGEVLVQMVLPNRRGDARNPITIINHDGIAMSFVKRGAPFAEIVEQQLRASRGKATRDAHLVLAVQSDLLTGPVDDNVRAVSSMFQPQKYTSFNGAVLMQWSYNFGGLIEHEFDYVNNPYARNPVDDLTALFRPL